VLPPAIAGAQTARMEKLFFVYIMASRYRGTLYTGVTSDIIRRVSEHRCGVIEGFTKTYAIKALVWWEVHDTAFSAIRREKRIKRWARTWKFKLIETRNPDWTDLAPRLLNDVPWL
jgi:putative endonuclease